MTSITITAASLASAMWGHMVGDPIEALNNEVYKGTSIRARAVPADAILTIITSPTGAHTAHDSDGGWIADRFGPTIPQRYMAAIRSAAIVD